MNGPVTHAFAPGEMVFCREALYNDGGLPGVEEGALLAAAGTRGVVVKCGHLEEAPDVAIYLVRFEGADEVLGPPVGCLAGELTQEGAGRPAA